MDTLFTKMHGLGNDFVILDQRQSYFPLEASLIQKISNRRLGIGCDQLISLEAPTSSDAEILMRIYNADGQEVEACGNATRCVGFLLTQETQRKKHLIETKAGLIPAETLDPQHVMIDLGKPRLMWSEIPLAHEVDTLHMPLEFEGLRDPVAVNVGNPHLIFFVYDVESIDLERIGRYLSRHPLFVAGTNVEIIEIINKNSLKMRVYERGVGITPACGTGAAASVVAAQRRNLIQGPTHVFLEGGELYIKYEDTVQLTGKVTLTFQGHLNLATFK